MAANLNVNCYQFHTLPDISPTSTHATEHNIRSTFLLHCLVANHTVHEWLCSDSDTVSGRQLRYHRKLPTTVGRNPLTMDLRT
jgi:hypothetical protein